MKKQPNQRKGRRRSTASGSEKQYPQGWVPIKAPENLEEMFEHWVDCDEPNIGWCLMCDSPICSEADLIPGTSSHNCEACCTLDAKIRAAEAAEPSSRKQ